MAFCDSDSASCGAGGFEGTPVLLGARLVCGGGSSKCSGSSSSKCSCSGPCSGSCSSDSTAKWSSACSGTSSCTCDSCSSSTGSCRGRVCALELESCDDPGSCASSISELPACADIVVGKSHRRGGRRNPGENALGFRALVCPVKELRPTSSPCEAFVQFWVRRKNGVVTLQWEGFRGRIGANGTCFLTVSQTICNLPPVDLSFPIRTLVKSEPTDGYLWVAAQRTRTCDQLRFYLGCKACENDCLEVPGGAVSWITM